MEKQREGSNMKVMVAIDETEYSHYALMWVLNNLKESITNLPLVIFAAQPTPNFNYSYAAPLGFARLYCPVSAMPELIDTVQARNNKITAGILEKAKSICSSRGVKAETITEVGDPKETICKVVQEYKINLLVVGNNADGGLKRVFSGSLSNYCFSHAKCAVLVVKKPE